MTTQELIDYYSNLLIIQYTDKPKAYATIQALVESTIMDQLPLTLQDSFDTETSIGDQLDIIGKYVGAKRISYSFTGPIELDDDDFRTMIKIAIIKNNFGSSLYEIQQILFDFFAGSMLVFDFKNMRMSYFFDSAIGSRPLAEVFVKSGFLPKPMGVQLAALIYSSNITNFYGFRSYDLPGYNNTGFNDYITYDMTSPWLSYTDSI